MPVGFGAVVPKLQSAIHAKLQSTGHKQSLERYEKYGNRTASSCLAQAV